VSDNVAQAIEEATVGLIDKLNTNVAIANVVMALLGRLVIIAAQRGKPIEGIALESPQWSGNGLRAKITFNSLSIIPYGVWSGQSDVMKYALSRSAHLAKVFQKNPGLIKFFTELVMKLDAFSSSRGIQWVDLQLSKAFITPSDVLVLNVAKEHTGRWS
jgi:hypothetical protein